MYRFRPALIPLRCLLLMLVSTPLRSVYCCCSVFPVAVYNCPDRSFNLYISPAKIATVFESIVGIDKIWSFWSLISTIVSFEVLKVGQYYSRCYGAATYSWVSCLDSYLDVWCISFLLICANLLIWLISSYCLTNFGIRRSFNYTSYLCGL